MEIMELLKALVETDDKMERMALVESNPIATPSEEPMQNGDPELIAKLQSEIETLKQKYIDTFFNGGVEPVEEKETEPEPKQTLDELLGGI